MFPAVQRFCREESRAMKATLAKILNVINLIALILATLELAVSYGNLPAQIVTRYALDGSLGATGKKSTLLVLVIMMWALTGFMLFVDLVPKFYQIQQGASAAEETEVGRIVKQTLAVIKLAVNLSVWSDCHQVRPRWFLGRHR